MSNTFTSLLSFCFFAFAQVLAASPSDSLSVPKIMAGNPLDPCTGAFPVTCGDTLLSQTNQFSSNTYQSSYYSNCYDGSSTFSAPDLVYKLELPEFQFDPQNVRIVMDILGTADLDLFLFAGCDIGPQFNQPAQPLGCFAKSLEDNGTTGIRREVLDVVLQPEQEYYLHVDGYNASQVGIFNLIISCQVSCTEVPVVDCPFGVPILSENFINYEENTSLALQSTRWRLWQYNSPDVEVVQEGSNDVLEVKQEGTVQPDVIYQMPNPTDGFGYYRMSWNMKIDTGKTAYYNVLHALPDYRAGFNGPFPATSEFTELFSDTWTGSSPNWAYEVFFNADGTGDLQISGTSSASDADFKYRPGEWNNVMQIIDINNDRVELWINHNFVRSWTFSQGSAFASLNFAGVNFFAIPNSSFRVDKICLWEPENFFIITLPDDTICIKNNTVYYNWCDASFYRLYTPAEAGACYGVCEQGGPFIELGDNFTGVLDPDDLAPPLLLQEQCVIDAYGGSLPPSPMYADIYVLPNEEGGFIAPQPLGGTSSEDTRFFMFRCYCNEGVCVQECLGEIGVNACDTSDCTLEGFYYLVALSPVNDTYGFDVFPTGPCSNMPQTQLTCDGTTTINGTLNAPFSNFSVALGGDYASCYNGTRNYGGSERLFRIDLSQPTKLDFTLVSTAAEPLGLFIFDKACGGNCLGYTEIPDDDEVTSLSVSLDEGIYYIIVDEENLNGNGGFALSYTCTQDIIFINTVFVLDTVAGCILDTSQAHNVGIRNFAHDFTTNHIIAFMTGDNADVKPIPDMSRFWNGSDPFVFSVPKDGGGSNQCSYAPGDTFQIFIFNAGDGWLSGGKTEVVFLPGTDSVFQANGSSVVNDLVFSEVNNFGISPSAVNVSANGAEKQINVQTNLPWHLEYDNVALPWLQFNDTEHQGGRTILLTISPSQDCPPRTALVRFVFEAEPPLYRYLQVTQYGPCVVPQVEINPGGTLQMCAGDSLVLTAVVTNSCPEAFNFRWNTGETTQSIKVSPAQTGNYNVALTSKNCVATGGKSVIVTVIPPPPKPSYNGQLQFCSGDPIVLQATSPPGTVTHWFNTPTGGTALHQDNSYSPNLPPGNHTFYLESVTTAAPVCRSLLPRLSITVSVTAKPDANAGDDRQLDCNHPTVTLNGSASTPANAIFAWTGPGSIVNQNTPTPTVNTAGQFTLTVTNGICQDVDLVQVTNIPPPTASITNVAIAKCFGQASGSATVIVTGGIAPFTYAWSAGGASATNNNLPAGLNTVTVTDGLGCATSSSVNIGQPSQVDVGLVNKTDINCFNPVGSAQVSSTGGTPGYTYLWSNGATGATANFTVGDVYGVTATDANGCTDATSVTISQTLPPQATAAVQTNVTCFGLSNGSATASGTGGIAPYNFQWSNGTSGTSLSQVPAGNYVVTLTDGMGCQSTASVVVTQPPLLGVGMSSTNQSIPNANDGTATATPTGGTPPYTFAWNTMPVQTTQTIVNLAPGTYIVIVTDSKGCTATGQTLVNIAPCTGIGVSATSTNVTCKGASNGTATATGSGMPTFNFEWSNGATGQTITNLPPGTYGVTMTDATGCSQSASTTITEPLELFANVASTTSVKCFGDQNGAATLTATGGTAPYNFIWQNGSTGATVNNLPAGSHVATVTDSKGCQKTVIVSITQPPVLSATTTATNETSVNGNDGTASVNPTGGTPTYTYLWSNGQTSQTIMGLAPDDYTVTVTDQNGCQTTATATVLPVSCVGTQVTVITSQFIVCHGEATGSLFASPQGGAGPFSYNWSNGATGVQISNLAAGVYIVTMTDGDFCEATAQATLTQPDSMTMTVASMTQPKCYGGSDGKITASVTGGTPSYQFNWSTGASGPTASNLSGGTYTVTVSDNNNCENYLQITLPEPPELSLELVTQVDVNCFVDSNGVLVVAASGGTGISSIAWSNGDVGALIDELLPGTYVATATDQNGCTETLQATVNGPTSPIQFEQVVVIPASEGQNNGSIELTITGGTPPYAIVWTDTANTFVAFTEDIFNLPSGEYECTVIDANNCGAAIGQFVPTPTTNPFGGLDVQVFPNPSSGKFSLSFTGGSVQKAQIEVTGILGRTLLSRSLEYSSNPVETLDLTGNPPGVYFLKIAANGRVWLRRLVVQ